MDSEKPKYKFIWNKNTIDYIEVLIIGHFFTNLLINVWNCYYAE